MPAASLKRDPIPETFETLEELDAFWSAHSLAAYEDLTHVVRVQVALVAEEPGSMIELRPATADRLRRRADERGTSISALLEEILELALPE